MNLLFDEMWPPWMAEVLRSRGRDVEAVDERADLAQQADSLIFETAQRERRAIVTENVRDYRHLANQAFHRGESHWGLIFTSNRAWPRHTPKTFSRLVQALDDFMRARPEPDALRNQEWWPPAP